MGIEVTYVLDLAELPTFELMQTWGTPQGTPKTVLDQKGGRTGPGVGRQPHIRARTAGG